MRCAELCSEELLATKQLHAEEKERQIADSKFWMQEQLKATQKFQMEIDEANQQKEKCVSMYKSELSAAEASMESERQNHQIEKERLQLQMQKSLGEAADLAQQQAAELHQCHTENVAQLEKEQHATEVKMQQLIDQNTTIAQSLEDLKQVEFELQVRF